MHYDSEQLAITISETAEAIQKVYPRVVLMLHPPFSVDLELIEAILLRFVLDDQSPYTPAVRVHALRALQQKIQNSPEDYSKLLYSPSSCANDISRLALQEAHCLHARVQRIEKMIVLADLDNGIENLQQYQRFRSKNLLRTHSFFDVIVEYVAKVVGEYPEALHKKFITNATQMDTRIKALLANGGNFSQVVEDNHNTYIKEIGQTFHSFIENWAIKNPTEKSVATGMQKWFDAELVKNIQKEKEGMSQALPTKQSPRAKV